MAEDNKWLIAISVIAVVAIVAVVGMVQITGYMVRERPVAHREALLRSSAQMMLVSRSMVMEGRYDAAAAILGGTETMLISSGLESDAALITRTRQAMLDGDFDSAIRLIDRQLLDWDFEFGWDFGWDIGLEPIEGMPGGGQDFIRP